MVPDHTRFDHRPIRMSRRRFWRRLGRHEHERLEFKRSAAHLQESVVAMAMTRGGTIVVGVADDGEIVGCDVDQALLDRIAAVAHETGVPLEARVVRIGLAGAGGRRGSGRRVAARAGGGRREVVLVAVPAVADRLVTTTDGRLLRRLGAANQPLRGDALQRFVGARAARWDRVAARPPPSAA